MLGSLRMYGAVRLVAVMCLVCAGLSVMPGVLWASSNDEEDNASRFDAVIDETARAHSLDPLLVKALIWHESRFNPRATGSSGEIGLMQIKMMVVKDWAKANGKPVPPRDQVYDPYLNVEIGVWYLARAYKRWEDNSHCLLLALGEYNAGRGKVLSWISRHGGRVETAIGKSASASYVRSIRDKYIEYSAEVAERNSVAQIRKPNISSQTLAVP